MPTALTWMWMGSSFHTWAVRVIEIQILPLSKIEWDEPSALQKCRTLPLIISYHFPLGYHNHLCFLPSRNYVEHTLELNDLPVQKLPGSSCWGSFYRCKNCPHDIWGSWYTPITPQGCWTHLLPFLWTLQPHSCERMCSTSWYYWCQTGRGKINIYIPSRGMYFMIPEFIHLMPWITLVSILLDHHNPLF